MNDIKAVETRHGEASERANFMRAMQSIYEDLIGTKVPGDVLTGAAGVYRSIGYAAEVVGEVMIEAAELWAGDEYEALANELTPIPPAGEAVSR